MFRRKEESANDLPNSAGMPVQPAGNTHAYGHGHGDGAAQPQPQPQSPSSSAATAAGGQSASSNTYVPTAPVARAAVSEPARPAMPVAASYRPAPVAEFNRGAARTPGEAMRATVNATTSSFSSATGEKAPAGKSNRRVLTVGNDILLKGEIATCDRLVIEGRVEAKLSEVHTVEIAECGSFKGTAEVEDAEISGVFEGDLIVRSRLVIYASGEVRGNITYGEIEIERGGRLTGQIKTVAAGKNKAATASFEASSDKNRPSASKEATAAA